MRLILTLLCAVSLSCAGVAGISAWHAPPTTCRSSQNRGSTRKSPSPRPKRSIRASMTSGCSASPMPQDRSVSRTVNGKRSRPRCSRATSCGPLPARRSPGRLGRACRYRRGPRRQPRHGADHDAELTARGRRQKPGAFSTWSNQSKPISLTMRFDITISRHSSWSPATCWWLVNGGM